MAITVQGANDVPPTTAITITTIGTSGALSANGTSSGAVAAYALTGIRLNVTAISGGTETWQITCSTSTSGGGGGSGGNVTIVGPVPVPVTTPAPAPTGAQGAIVMEGVANGLPLPVSGGSTATILTSASATTCTNLFNTTARLWSITNSGPATAIFPAFYQDTGTTCATGTAFFGDATTITLGPGAIYFWAGGLPLSGLAYKLSAALTAGQNLIIVTGPK